MTRIARPADRRPNARRRGYDRAWERLRKAFLADNPLCAYCARLGWVVAATMVDHVKPIAQRPDLRLEWSNLQSLCNTCHSGVKQSEERTGRTKGCGTDGVPLDPTHHWHGAGR